jgi:ribosomal protein L5
MNVHAKSREAEEAEQNALRIKKLVMRMSIGDSNLSEEIKQAFNLAKSSGQELDLTFSRQTA